jgi:hypothetical protein
MTFEKEVTLFKGMFSDNYFDLIPGNTKRVTFITVSRINVKRPHAVKINGIFFCRLISLSFYGSNM